MAASSGGRLWRRLWRRPPAVVGAVVVLFFITLAVGAPWIAPSDPQRSDYGKIRKAPSAAHPPRVPPAPPLKADRPPCPRCQNWMVSREYTDASRATDAMGGAWSRADGLTD